MPGVPGPANSGRPFRVPPDDAPCTIGSNPMSRGAGLDSLTDPGAGVEFASNSATQETPEHKSSKEGA